MTQEQAKRELEGTWIFKETNGMIALRDVALIEAVKAYVAGNASEQREAVSPTRAPHAWPTL